MYLTPERYKTMGFGIDLTDVEDFELAALCQQASAIINAYCLVPRIPQVHDFKGGSITREQHAWRYPSTPFDIGQRRAWPYHWPILAVSQFRIKVTNTQYVEIAPTELFINNSDRYLEVVSLAITSSGLFNALIVPNVGLATPVVEIDYTYGWDFTATDEIVYATDGLLYRTANQFWAATPTAVVKRNGTPITSGFALDSTEGTIVFDSPNAATDVISITYHYRLPAEIAQAAGFIVTHLHGEAELRAKGMENVRRLTVAEVTIERASEPSNINAQNLSYYAPEASALLATYRFDHVTAR